MSDINYSIIIPHRNTPDLLQKCLDSIPLRLDVQVIVVDDNSDADKVDFGNFPRWKGEHYECYLTKEGKGAGYARNVGLEHAKGNWIVFSDADDFFMPGLCNAMDQYQDSSADIVFFKCTSQQVRTGLPGRRFSGHNAELDKAAQTGDFGILLQNTTPVMKFFRHEVIKTNNIRFQEVRWGNDVYFYSKFVACSSSYVAADEILYCVTEGASSLASNKSLLTLKSRLEVETNAARLLLDRLDTTFTMFWLYKRWWSIWQQAKLYALFALPKVIYRTRGRVMKPLCSNFVVDEYNASPRLKKIVQTLKRKI